MEKIAINQLGYRVGQRKLATVTGEYDSFVIREKESKNIVIQGKILEERYDIDSQQNVKLADFSSLNTAGEYIFCVGEEDKGIEFSVGEDIYKDVFRKMLVFFIYKDVVVPLVKRSLENGDILRAIRERQHF